MIEGGPQSLSIEVLNETSIKCYKETISAARIEDCQKPWTSSRTLDIYNTVEAYLYTQHSSDSSARWSSIR